VSTISLKDVFANLLVPIFRCSESYVHCRFGIVHKLRNLSDVGRGRRNDYTGYGHYFGDERRRKGYVREGRIQDFVLKVAT